MSRTKALKTIPQATFEDSMKGIVCDVDPAVRDEAPQAYKDLDTVIAQQDNLCEIVHRLLPLVNVKGYEKKHRKNNNRRGQKAAAPIKVKHN